MRVMALALSAVFGLGQLLPVLHFVLVAHQLCAEHGDLVHTDDARDAAHASESRTLPSETQLVSDAGESHAHDHCGVALSSPTHGVSLAGPAASLSAEWYVEAGPGAARSAHASIALLLYAPKLAPPVAGA